MSSSAATTGTASFSGRWLQLARVPLWARRTAARALGEKLQRVAEVITSADETELYTSLIASPWSQSPLAAAHDLELVYRALPAAASPVHRVMLADATGYLTDDILMKVDRATMAVGLESRMPYLDHRVFECAWRLPLALNLRAGTGKRLLRQLLYRHVPRALVDWSKMGFAAPLGGWLRGLFRPWAEEPLERSTLRSAGLEPEPIRRMWGEHLRGARHWQYQLWNVLMFQAWVGERRRIPESGPTAAREPQQAPS